MKINNKTTFPYAVVGVKGCMKTPMPSDNFELTVYEQDDKYVLEGTLNLDNADVVKLLDEGKAVNTVELDCKSTNFHELLEIQGHTFIINVPRSAVKDKVEILCFVTAKEEINGYVNSDADDDFAEFPADINPGQVLVAYTPDYFTANRADIHHRNFSGIVKYQKKTTGDLASREVEYDITGDSIIILIPANMFGQCQGLMTVQAFQPVTQTSLLLPAFAHALMHLNEYTDKSWAIQLREYLPLVTSDFDPEETDEEISSEDAFSYAQQLLSGPVARVAEFVNAKMNQNSDD